MTTDLRRLLSEATPGPWAWFNSKVETHLATIDRGQIYVMGFARRGMNGAQPMFQVRPDGPGSGVMRTAAELGDAMKSHPDAALIVAAVNVLPAHLAVVDAARKAAISNHAPMLADGPVYRACACTVHQDLIAALDKLEPSHD